QAIKAGILEIADIHVVSKCDRSDANRTLVDLKQMLMLGAGQAAAGAWAVPGIGTSAISGEGLDELAAALARHRDVAFGTDAGTRRRQSIASFRLRKTAEALVLERFGGVFARQGVALAAQMMRRQADPYSLADQLLASSFPQEHTHEQDARSSLA